MRTLLSSSEETIQFGKELGKRLPVGSIVLFEGELAAGKTTMIKGIAAGAADYPEEQVSSPTFVYMQIYEGSKTLFHFDLYRLSDPDEFTLMGFDEAFDAGGITLIEWPERIQGHIPSSAIRISLAHSPCGGREVTLEGIEI